MTAVPALDSGLYVTTSLSPTDSMESFARKLSYRLCCQYVHRGSRRLFADAHSGAIAIVVEADGVAVRVREAAFRYHPNVAKLRVLQLLRGARDRMVAAMKLSPGDSVLDCTCGLGADATVASFAVGEPGAVRALETSKVLAEIVSMGLESYEDEVQQLVHAMRRVEVVNASYQSFLRKSKDGEYDVVYFDPMFEVTYGDSTGLDLVRLLGAEGAPCVDDVREAARVARRCVVMKDRTPGERLHALGFTIVSRGRKTCFGMIDTRAAVGRNTFAPYDGG